MHYANCNTYNADFDGDEMNLHFVQSELARAEAYQIAATDEQYIVPTNGKPLRGLIQDHVVMGVLLTKTDTFLTKADAMQLLVLSGTAASAGERITLPPPAVLRPCRLWTGKQIITALLHHLHPAARSLNTDGASKTPASAWRHGGGTASAGSVDDGLDNEAKVIVRGGELLCGVLDKVTAATATTETTATTTATTATTATTTGTTAGGVRRGGVWSGPLGARAARRRVRWPIAHATRPAVHGLPADAGKC